MEEFELGNRATAVLSLFLVILGLAVCLYFNKNTDDIVRIIGAMFVIFGTGGLAISQPIKKNKKGE